MKSNLITICLVAAFMLATGVAQATTIEVSQPVQVTSDSHYERGQSIVFDGTNYWLFYGRSSSVTGNYGSGDPDVHDYVVYYKKETSVAGLTTGASAAPISGVANNANGYLGETGAAYFGGEVWAFATIDVGANADLYGWWTSDAGTTWNEVGPIISGMSDGQAHHDETVFNGELWVVEGSGNFTTQHSATPKTGGWSAPLNVDAALTGGLVHFFVDGTDLYLAINSSAMNYIYKYNSGTVAWDLVDDNAPPNKYDPTLFKLGSDYVFAQAPWDGTKQYILQWAGATLDSNFFDTTYAMVTEGAYGSNPWVDMWPIGFTDDNGDTYLLFTSERNPSDPSTEIAGNIWYLKVDWTVTNDHYTYIQEAVDAATGTTITVAAGTYAEYLIINKDNITLQGAGIDVSIIDLDGLTPYWHYSGCSSSFASRAGVYFSGYGNPDEVVENCVFKGFTVKNAGLNPPITATGTHTAVASSATVLSDNTKSWTIDELVGQWVHNYGDKDPSDWKPARSYGLITANTADTVTVASLSGGQENDWDTGDPYLITPYEEFHNTLWVHYQNYDAIRGISIANGKNVTIRDCKVTDCGYGGITTGYGRCVSTHKYSEDITVDNCIVTDHPTSGIGIGSNVGVFTITNNTCERIKRPHYEDPTREYAGYGIQVSGKSSSQMASGLISNNTCSDNGFEGIIVDKYTDGVIVEKNTVTGHNFDEDGAGIFFYHWGHPEYCKNHIIRDNTVTGNIRGIIAYYASESTIENNTITTDSGSFDSGQGAIKLDYANNITVQDNTISCDGTGITVTSSDSNNNTLTGNTISGAKFAGVYIRSGAHDNLFTCNTITGTTSETFTFWADWGVHDGGDNQAILTDSTKSWTDDAFIGMTVLNLTDGSEGTITDNDATTVTATLSGGTDDDWDNGDDYDIVYDETQADGVFLRGGSCYAAGHAGTGNVFHDNSIYGNDGDGMENQIATTVDAEYNWWGSASGPGGEGPGSGDEVSTNVDYAAWLSSAPDCPPSPPAGDNILWLNVEADSLYVKHGDSVVIDMDVLNLLQKVNGCQAMLKYSSTYLDAGSVAAGGGVWDEVIYESWAIVGELDTAIGLQAWGHVGTDADGTVAVITLTVDAGAPDGTTEMEFRADDPDDETKRTMLSDMSSQEVTPNKVNSQTIVVDNTNPSIDIDSAVQDSTDLLGGGNAVQGDVVITVSASDVTAGLDGIPTVTVTPFGGALDDISGTGSDNGDGTFSYTYTVTLTTPNGAAAINASVSDKSGNSNSDTDTFDINKNEINGSIAMDTQSNADYNFDRDVVFKATGSGVLKEWTVEVNFVNDTGGSKIAAGTYELTDVPQATTALSAKTAWSLRERITGLDMSADDGQETADFIGTAGTDMLRGGDLNGSNAITILDFSVLKVNWFTANDVADINGSGLVSLSDFLIMKDNWFQKGDAE